MKPHLSRIVAQTVLFGAGVLAASFMPRPASAATSLPAHFTDGQFTSSAEWSGSSASANNFPVTADGSGGAVLYVDRTTAGNGQQTLWLMYDYDNSTRGSFTNANSFFDVFFQATPQGEAEQDYLVRIHHDSSFQAFEKPDSSGRAPVDANGNFIVTGANSPWTLLDASDLTLAQFHVGIGFNSSDLISPDPQGFEPHLMAEFDLAINSVPNGPANGLYGFGQAFWSASVGGEGVLATGDPPISSGIFTLSPDPTIGVVVTPTFAANGDPAQQPQDIANAVPEPTSLVMAGMGAIIVAGVVRFRSRLAG